jgi:Plant transposon protein
MPKDMHDLMQSLLLLNVISAVGLVLMDEDDEEEQEQLVHAKKAKALAKAMPILRRKQRRLLLANGDDPPVRKKPRRFDYDGAMNCIQRDYLGPDPFFGHYFERIFRVSRGIVEDLMQVLGNRSSFFTLQHNKITGLPGIRPEAKVLIALKQLAYGASGMAFLDYFQMSDTTARKCLKDFSKIISTSHLREQYLRMPSKADAKKLSAMHEMEFGVAGCLGCLDCMHVYWRTCPRAWHGQYEGKEGEATIVLEAFADYTTKIWHACFGFPGTLNDINIWDQSPLLRTFLDGSFARDVDFDFVVNGKVFKELWIMVDGIYPELSRFVKNHQFPVTEQDRHYSKWQEACRKSVERAFGILQRKFHILVYPMELFFEADIRHVVEACIILHNMMVDVRLSREQVEDPDLYQYLSDQHINNDPDGPTQEPPEVMIIPQPTTRERIDSLKVRWPQAPPTQADAAVMEQAIKDHFASLKLHWYKLYDRQKHFALRDAISEVVITTRKN